MCLKMPGNDIYFSYVFLATHSVEAIRILFFFQTSSIELLRNLVFKYVFVQHLIRKKKQQQKAIYNQYFAAISRAGHLLYQLLTGTFSEMC